MQSEKKKTLGQYVQISLTLEVEEYFYFTDNLKRTTIPLFNLLITNRSV